MLLSKGVMLKIEKYYKRGKQHVSRGFNRKKSIRQNHY